jgi:predicted O-methyltransferase YrrM
LILIWLLYIYTGSLLKTLVASKPGGRILELGTGSGLATSWMVSGLDKNAVLTTVENNATLLSVAQENLEDARINFVLEDGYNLAKRIQR